MFLGVSLGFDDLGRLLGVPGTDILGAFWVDRREVIIDQSLDPHENPAMEGRYNFSVGHEIGHLRLHLRYVAKADRQVAMFANHEPKPAVICRSSQKKAPIEWQADYFSACFHMPRQQVFDAWSACFGSLRPFVYADVADQGWTRGNKYRGSRPTRETMSKVVEAPFEPHAYAFETIAKEFNSMFGMSPQAMRIRLENLGLLRVDHADQRDLFGGF